MVICYQDIVQAICPRYYRVLSIIEAEDRCLTTIFMHQKFWTAVDLDDSNHAKQLKELCSNANAVGLRGMVYIQ